MMNGTVSFQIQFSIFTSIGFINIVLAKILRKFSVI